MSEAPKDAASTKPRQRVSPFGNRTKFVLLNAVLFVSFNLIYAILFWMTQNNIGGPILMYVIIAATLGAAVYESTLIPTIPETVPFFPVAVNWFWKMIVSGVLAVFAYTVFAGGVLQGSLFPRFVAADVPFENMLTFLRDIKPATNSDVAKALVWSFIAGYSEKFVPNIFRWLDDSSAKAIRGEGEAKT